MSQNPLPESAGEMAGQEGAENQICLSVTLFALLQGKSIPSNLYYFRLRKQGIVRPHFSARRSKLFPGSHRLQQSCQLLPNCATSVHFYSMTALTVLVIVTRNWHKYRHARCLCPMFDKTVQCRIRQANHPKATNAQDLRLLTCDAVVWACTTHRQ